MKIAQVFEYFGDGGAEAQAFLLAKKSREGGDEPIIIANRFSIDAQKMVEHAGIDFFFLSMQSSFNPIKVVKSALGMKKLIDEQQIHVIHTHMLREQSIAVLAKIIGAKFILIRTFHRFDQFNFKMKPLMVFYKKFTDGFISISDEMTKYLDKHGIKTNLSQIYNGVEKVIVDSHQPAIGFIGRLAKEKHVFDFIQANEVLLKTTKMVVAGDGPEQAMIQQFVEARQLKVDLMGQVTDKAEFFKQISVLVLPSETEVMPMSVLEAYSCGLPVVAFNLDSLKEIIGSTNGKLIDYPNYTQMGQVAASYIETDEYYKQTNTDIYEQKYSVDTMWTSTATLYRSLYNSSPNMVK
jgi:L-malate glycosyltransferase